MFVLIFVKRKIVSTTVGPTRVLPVLIIYYYNGQMPISVCYMYACSQQADKHYFIDFLV